MEETYRVKSIYEYLKKYIEQGNEYHRKSDTKLVKIRYWQNMLKNHLRNLYEQSSNIFNEIKEDRKSLNESNKFSILEKELKFVKSLVEYLENSSIDNVQNFAKGIGKIFLGHGRNQVWNRIYIFLKDELHYYVEAFETKSRVSTHIIDILNKLLDSCNIAVIVMTGDDYTSEGQLRARQNVIHEIGLFQGRYGFNRVIVFQQSDVEEFSNIHVLQTVRYHTQPEEGFYELKRALEKLDKS